MNTYVSYRSWRTVFPHAITLADLIRELPRIMSRHEHGLADLRIETTVSR